MLLGEGSSSGTSRLAHAPLRCAPSRQPPLRPWTTPLQLPAQPPPLSWILAAASGQADAQHAAPPPAPGLEPEPHQLQPSHAGRRITEWRRALALGPALRVAQPLADCSSSAAFNCLPPAAAGVTRPRAHPSALPAPRSLGLLRALWPATAWRLRSRLPNSVSSLHRSAGFTSSPSSKDSSKTKLEGGWPKALLLNIFEEPFSTAAAPRPPTQHAVTHTHREHRTQNTEHRPHTHTRARARKPYPVERALQATYTLWKSLRRLPCASCSVHALYAGALRKLLRAF